ncbi:MAG: ABC transporter permease [Candidatus Hydrothermarchaeales archaeon]
MNLKSKSRLLALSKKEFGDIVREKVYLFAFGVQLIMVVGIIYTALLYTSIANPEVGMGFVQARVRVGVMGDYELKGEGLEVIRIRGGDPLRALRELDLAAVLVVPEGFEDAALRGEEVRFTLALDNTNLLSGYADAVVSNEVSELSEKLKRRNIARLADPEVVLAPIKTKELRVGVKTKTLPMDFIELMYGLLIPFMLLMPIFLSTNMMTDSIVGEKEKKTYEILVSAPLSKLEIILGKALPILAITMLQVVAWIALLEFKGIEVYNTLLLVLLLALMDLIFVGLGIGISAFSDTIKDANAGVSALILVVSLAFFAPLSVSRELYAFSPAALLSKLASNPVVSGRGILGVYLLLFSIGVGIIYLGSRLLDWKENLRL